jgi:catechol 2,3-dioxygenase-like lactoylglutathione lyase family enzyme
MIGYVTLGALDLAASTAFYEAVLGAIGYERKPRDDAFVYFGPKGGAPNVALCNPYDGQPARAGNGIMIAFAAASPEAVEAAHAAALANGGLDEGAPGFRPPTSRAWYGAYVRDPTGNKLCLFATPGG